MLGPSGSSRLALFASVMPVVRRDRTGPRPRRRPQPGSQTRKSSSSPVHVQLCSPGVCRQAGVAPEYLGIGTSMRQIGRYKVMSTGRPPLQVWLSGWGRVPERAKCRRCSPCNIRASLVQLPPGGADPANRRGSSSHVHAGQNLSRPAHRRGMASPADPRTVRRAARSWHGATGQLRPAS